MLLKKSCEPLPMLLSDFRIRVGDAAKDFPVDFIVVGQFCDFTFEKGDPIFFQPIFVLLG